MEKFIPSDSLYVLSSTSHVVSRAKHVTIVPSKYNKLAEMVLNQYANYASETAKTIFSNFNDIYKDTQFVLVSNALNFCFWAQKDVEPWCIELKDGTRTSGGWNTLYSSLLRAIDDGMPLLDAKYLISMSIKDVQHVFRSANGTEIPLLEKRRLNLNEVGRVLLQKYDGQFYNCLKHKRYSTSTLAKKIFKDFSSFMDMAICRNYPVYYFKRAQICVFDMWRMAVHCHPQIQIDDIYELTAFADYKLPQVMRHAGIIKYDKKLELLVDSYATLDPNSEYINEIRSATIQVVEGVRQYLECQGKPLCSAVIDYQIYRLSHVLAHKMKPFVRVLWDKC